MGQSPTITIHVPGPLRTYCAGAAQLSISAHTVRAALEDLQRSQSALYRNVCDETGTGRRVPSPELSRSCTFSFVVRPFAGTLQSNDPTSVSAFRTSPSPSAYECPNSDCFNLVAHSTSVCR